MDMVTHTVMPSFERLKQEYLDFQVGLQSKSLSQTENKLENLEGLHL